MSRLIVRLSTTLSTAIPDATGEFRDGWRLRRWQGGQHRIEARRRHIELEQHLVACIERPVEQRHQLAHRVTLVGVGMRGWIGDHLGVADEDGVDDAQPGSPQCAAGLGDLDDAVGDVRDLRLAGSVAQPDVGVDAVVGEVALGQLGILGRHAHAVGQFLDGRDRGVVGDGEDELDRVARWPSSSAARRA